MAPTSLRPVTPAAPRRWPIRLAGKLAIALVPVLGLLGPPALVWYRTGEFTGPIDAVAEQYAVRDADRLFGQAYSNNTRAYKWEAVRQARPAVLALGSSRVLEFRQAAFTSSFYNAGGTVDCVEDLGAGLFGLPTDALPKVVILGIDPWWFNTAYRAPGCGSPMLAFVPPAKTFASAWRDTWADYVGGKFTLAQVWSEPQTGHPHSIGLNARANGNGFRHDGSYRYGAIIARPDDPAVNPDVAFHATLARLRSGSGRFVPSAEASVPALTAFGAFVEACRARHIRVVAFLPPFPHIIISALRDQADQHRYLWTLKARLEATAPGLVVDDLSDLQALGLSDAEALDGYHCSEKAYVAVLLGLAERHPDLAAHLRPVADLRAGLQRATRRFEIF